MKGNGTVDDGELRDDPGHDEALDGAATTGEATAAEATAAEAIVAELTGKPAAKPTPLTADQRRILELEIELEDAGERLRQYAVSVDRVRAEFEASRGRLEREHQRLLASDKAEAAADLLAVLDNVDKALGSAKAASMDSFVAGVQMIRTDFEAALGKMGIVRYDANGERFDPERHQAMTAVPVTDPALDNRVVESITAGAALGDKVIRPAVVVVGRYVAPKADEDTN